MRQRRSTRPRSSAAHRTVGRIGNRAMLRALGTGRIQTKAMEEPAPAGGHKQEAVHAAQAVTGPPPAARHQPERSLNFAIRKDDLREVQALFAGAVEGLHAT